MDKNQGKNCQNFWQFEISKLPNFQNLQKLRNLRPNLQFYRKQIL